MNNNSIDSIDVNVNANVLTNIQNRILYEDNHIIIINKLCSELVQSDKTNDECLLDMVKKYIKVKYNKPNNVYLGLPHRLDRPTSGAVIFCKTEKSLVRFNDMFKNGEVDKKYLCICDAEINYNQTEDGTNSGKLTHYIRRNSENNKSYAYVNQRAGTKRAELNYKLIAKSDRYFLYEIELLTGRHHQIRAQLAALSVHIKGDLKYGAKRSNPDGGIDLHSYQISFIHPVSKTEICIKAPPPPNFNIFLHR